MYLDEASVTGTETALLAAATIEGVTEIRHAATEPHVVEVCEFLQSMGVGITGAGSSTIRVEGTTRPRGVTHKLQRRLHRGGQLGRCRGGDRRRDRGARRPRRRCRRHRVRAEAHERGLHVRRRPDDHPEIDSRSRREESRQDLWPSFPSDFVSLVTVLATQADGRTLIHDWMYELRLFALEQLSGMRADLFLCDPHRIIVTGPSKLKGRKLDSRDLRSGMALIAAGLAAEGQSRLSPLETVERGYGQLVERLKMLGAQVEQVEQRVSPPQV